MGLEMMGSLDLSLSIYARRRARAGAGIIIADTKFEFGIPEGAEVRSGRSWSQPIVIDEALTPDSSRFWPAARYEPGRAQPSYDKQFVREYLEELVGAGAWDKTPPGPELPARVVEGTLSRYRERGPGAARVVGNEGSWIRAVRRGSAEFLGAVFAGHELLLPPPRSLQLTGSEPVEICRRGLCPPCCAGGGVERKR